jgi:N-formylglutamate deformylase
MQPVFHMQYPEQIMAPVIMCSPHSGRYYPKGFLRDSLLDAHMIRTSEDAFVDHLIADAPQFGIPTLVAHYPRAYVDLNRGHDEWDHGVIENLPRGSAARQTAHARVGLGVIPRIVAQTRPIYRGKIPFDVAQARVDAIWHPYHDQLTQMMKDMHGQFGRAILVDMHSMPRAAIATGAHSLGARGDVILGDRFGASAHPDYMAVIEACFRDAGLSVQRNVPFAGAYILKHYGRPRRNWHAIQIEIDRSLYMDEHSITPHSGFDDLRAVLARIIAQLADAFGHPDLSMAAQ